MPSKKRQKHKNKRRRKNKKMKKPRRKLQETLCQRGRIQMTNRMFRKKKVKTESI